MPWDEQNLVLNVLRDLDVKPTLIIEGGARGADRIAKVIAIFMGIPVQEFPADWKTYGKKAGHLRNQQMLDENPDLVIAFHPSTGITPGTRDMVTRAQAKGTPVQIHTYEVKP
jgi:hypothetical protein